MEDNEEEIEETNKNSSKKFSIKNIFKALGHCPRFIRNGILVLVIILIFLLGVKYSYVFTSKQDTLGIEFKNVGELVTRFCFCKGFGGQYC